MRRFVIFIVLLFSLELNAQKSSEEAANLWSLGFKTQALDKINDVIKKDRISPENYWLKSIILQGLNRHQESVETLSMATNLPIGKNESLIRLLFLLWEEGEYIKADSCISENKNIQVPDSNLVRWNFIKACVKYSLEQQKITQYSPIDLGDAVNTKYENYYPFVSIDENTLFFTVRGQNRSDYSDENEDIYWSKKINKVWSESSPLDLVNGRFDEGAVSLSADGRYLFFVVSNKRDDFGSADIYYTFNNNGQWSNPINAGSDLNTAYWESTPSVSRDMKTLYFSSNRPGGYGKKDLWQVSIFKQSDGTLKWGVPDNMGSDINTSGEELSPFIHPDGKHLYFSSDGYVGMGGLDIVCSIKDSIGTWMPPINMGGTINSFRNELGFVTNSKGTDAYLSSNYRTGNRRLYSISLKNVQKDVKPISVLYVKGKVFDAETKRPISARISVRLDKRDGEELTTSILSNGEYFLSLPSDVDAIIVSSEKKGYLYQTEFLDFKTIDLENGDNGWQQDVYMQPIKVGVVTLLKDIYFDFDDYTLQNRSSSELYRLCEFLEENPGVCIEIGGYTDNKGTKEYNKHLSFKRAKAVLDFLVNRGIDENRLTAIGYGVEEAKSSNESEDGRAQNRRTEVKILKTK